VLQGSEVLIIPTFRGSEVAPPPTLTRRRYMNIYYAGINAGVIAHPYDDRWWPMMGWSMIDGLVDDRWCPLIHGLDRLPLIHGLDRLEKINGLGE
jgi:hypothetical protein